MAGFAVLFQDSSSEPERKDSFLKLLQQTTRFKQLDEPSAVIEGRFCTAAKIDAPSSLHRGIVRDERSGSWLMAAGTVVALEGNNDPHELLVDLLKGYIDCGIEALERYDGHFGLIIYNGRENSLSIISDPMGLFAIYYAHRGQQVFVSTSALAVACQVGSKADALTIECFLRTGRLYGEKTLWEDVRRVRPATALIITPHEVLEKEYWSLRFDEEISNLGMKDALELADKKISGIFEKFIGREGKVWADLTGGFDTRVTSMYLAKNGFPFTAYCVGPAGHPDVEISKLICQEMGWDYRHMPLPDHWLDEKYSWFDAALGKGDGSLSVFQLAETLQGQQERSNLYKVHVTGGGVDEWRYHNYSSNTILPSTSTIVNYSHILDTRIIYVTPQRVMNSDRTAEVRSALTEYLSNLVSDFSNHSSIIQTDVIFRRYRHPIHIGAYLSAESGILRALTPFCSKDLEVFGMSLNHYWRLKYHFGFVRNLIENNNIRLSHMKTAWGGPAMPIRFSNIFRFVDLWQHLIDHFAKKATRKLGRTKRILTAQDELTNSLSAERIGWLNWVASEKLFEPSQMRSGALYKMPELINLWSHFATESGYTKEFLDRVVTVEMAMRATGASVE